MAVDIPTIEQIVSQAQLLSVRSRLQLIEQLVQTVIASQVLEKAEDDVSVSSPGDVGLVQQSSAHQLKPLLGLWRGFTISEEDITEARHELWGNFGERDF